MSKIVFVKLTLCFIVWFTSVFSQSKNISNNRDVSDVYDKYEEHTSVKPYNNQYLYQYSDSVLNFLQAQVFTKKRRTNEVHPNNALMLTPIADFNLGYERSSNIVNNLGGGVNFSYTSNKIGFNINAFSSSSVYPNYVDSIAKYAAIIPGWGRAYSSKNGYSMQKIWGYVSYSPNKIFNFQTGIDKHFFGDGFRSLFLSDVAAPYPFLKLSAKVWKIKYVSLFAWHKDVTAPSHLKNDFKDKFGTFHYISWNAKKWLNLNIFESIVLQGKDTNRVRSFDVNYLNPVVFFRPVEYSLGSSDNAFLGFGFKIKCNPQNYFYGQLALDEFYLSQIKARNGWWANKQAVQLGFKSTNLFRIKNLAMRLESNIVRPYMYAHGSVQQNYGHFNQSLAHPLGANFYEALGILTYRCKNILVEGKAIYAVYGADSAGYNMGHNIFLSYQTRPHEFGNELTQGVKTKLMIAGLRCAYLISKELNFQIEAGSLLRSERNNSFAVNTLLFYFGFKTRLWTDYDDY